jgi:hypothetical protein
MVEWLKRWRAEGYRALWNRAVSTTAKYEKLLASQPRVVARAREQARKDLIERLSVFTSDPEARPPWTHVDLIRYLSEKDKETS